MKTLMKAATVAEIQKGDRLIDTNAPEVFRDVTVRKVVRTRKATRLHLFNERYGYTVVYPVGIEEIEHICQAT